MAVGDIDLYVRYYRSMLDGDGGGVLSGAPADLNTDTIKIVVLKDTFTPDVTGSSSQHHFDDVSASEVATATAYTGPITLATPTVNESAGVITYDAVDVTIALDAGGFTDARYIAFYKDSGTPATSPLIAIGDLGSNQSITSAPLEFQWNVAGILTLDEV